MMPMPIAAFSLDFSKGRWKVLHSNSVRTSVDHHVTITMRTGYIKPPCNPYHGG